MKEGNRHYYYKRLILVSLSCFGVVIYVLVNNLIPFLTPTTPFEGKVESAEITTEGITDRGTKMKEVKLTINLKEYDKKFSLIRQVDQNDKSEKFGDILKRLNDSSSATIWIKYRNKQNPKVYQLDVDGKTVFKIHEDLTSSIPVLILSFLLGTSSLYSVLTKRYPNKFQLFNKKTKTVSHNR